MMRNKQLLIIIGYSKLATKIIETCNKNKCDRLIVSRRNAKKLKKELAYSIQHKNEKKLIEHISKYRSVNIINTSANYELKKINICNSNDGNHIFPKKIIELIPKNKLKKVINIDTALNKYKNKYSKKKYKHSSWQKRNLLTKKISLLNLKVESFYYLDGENGTLIDYLYHCYLNSIEAKIHNKDELRDFISVEQVIKIVMKLFHLDFKKGIYKNINIKTGQLYKTEELPKTIKNILDKKVNYPANKIKFKNPDSRLEKIIGRKILNLEEDLISRNLLCH